MPNLWVANGTVPELTRRADVVYLCRLARLTQKFEETRMKCLEDQLRESLEAVVKVRLFSSLF